MGYSTKSDALATSNRFDDTNEYNQFKAGTTNPDALKHFYEAAEHGLEPFEEGVENEVEGKHNPPSQRPTAHSQNTYILRDSEKANLNIPKGSAKKVQANESSFHDHSFGSNVNYSNMDCTSSPILLLDVNLGNGNIQRIMFHEDDDPVQFADKIARENSMPFH